MKRIIPLLLALALLFCGCRSRKEIPPVEDLAAQLHQAGVFSTEISPVDPAVAQMIYYFNEADVEEGAFYFSSGASADELALVKAPTEQAAMNLKAVFQERLDLQKAAYADYMPEELVKLEGAQLYRNGIYVLFCVAEDPAPVMELANQYF